MSKSADKGACAIQALAAKGLITVSPSRQADGWTSDAPVSLMATSRRLMTRETKHRRGPGRSWLFAVAAMILLAGALHSGCKRDKPGTDPATGRSGASAAAEAAGAGLAAAAGGIASTGVSGESAEELGASLAGAVEGLDLAEEGDGDDLQGDGEGEDDDQGDGEGEEDGQNDGEGQASARAP